MKFTLPKQDFLDNLTLASRFTSSRLSTVSSLQGVLLSAGEKALHIYATNLNSFFHTKMKIAEAGECKVVVDPKKLAEFVALLEAAKIEVEVSDKELVVAQGKTRGVFQVAAATDFPMPPKISGDTQKIETKFLTDALSQVLFSTAADDTRPVLTAVNFTSEGDEDLVVVTTDGFRLSHLKLKGEVKLPKVLVAREFLSEVVRFVKDEEEVGLSYSEGEKTISVRAGDCEFYSRVIEGEFPPYERVIPAEKKTTVEVGREEFLRHVKLISVFARDHSNIVVVEFTKEGVHVRPKAGAEGSDAFFEAESFEGESQKVAFNFRFLIDFLNNVSAKKIVVEILRPDAPVVFKPAGAKNYLHIIMPVRLQAE